MQILFLFPLSHSKEWGVQVPGCRNQSWLSPALGIHPICTPQEEEGSGRGQTTLCQYLSSSHSSVPCYEKQRYLPIHYLLWERLWDRGNGHSEMRQQARLHWLGGKGSRGGVQDIPRCKTAADVHTHVTLAARHAMLPACIAGK